MPNPIKYTAGTETLALKKGNFYIGTGDVGKGPSDSTGYYQGPSPATGGYVIYLNKSGVPGNLSYHSAANDSQLISFTNNLAGTSFTSATQCLNYYATQTDKVCFNRDYEGIVTSGLTFNLDAGFTPSYSRSGTTWYDVSGSNNGMLTNGPTFNSENGGSIVFDGVDDNVQLGAASNFISGDKITVEAWVRTNVVNTYKKIFVTVGQGTQSINGIYFSLGPNNDGGFNYGTYFGVTTSVAQTAAVWPNNISTTSFTNLTGTYDGSNIYLYVNGFLVAQQPLTGNIGTGGIARISGYDNNGETWNGNISNIKIYNRALSSTEVLQNYNAQKGRFGL
jgi:hypothetical protein